MLASVWVKSPQIIIETKELPDIIFFTFYYCGLKRTHEKSSQIIKQKSSFNLSKADFLQPFIRSGQLQCYKLLPGIQKGLLLSCWPVCVLINHVAVNWIQ